MATTSRGIPLYDDTNNVAPLQALLNGQSNALNSALNSLEGDLSGQFSAGSNMFKGTAAQRVAFTGATGGQLWQDTDGSGGLYRRSGSSWIRMVDYNATPHAMAAGAVSAISVAAGGATDTTVTLPSSRFNVAPIVTATQFGTGAARDVVVGVKAVTTTNFTLMRGNNGTVARSNISAHWQAIQMTPSAAAG